MTPKSLDYFGPFKYENILVNLALEATTEHAPTGNTSKKAPTKSNENDILDMYLIVCETEARMRAVANVATALGEPYVPFKLLFVEGLLETDFDGDIGMKEVPMMVAACLLGDYNSVFLLRKICSRDSIKPNSFHEIHTKSNALQQFPPCIINEILPAPGGEIEFGKTMDDIDQDFGYEDRTDVWHDLEKNGYGLGLKVGLQASHSDVTSGIVKSCLHEQDGMIKCCRKGFPCLKTVYLPGLDGQGKETEDGVSLFHRNEKGDVTFTEKEAERASNFIASFGLEERVKAALQKKRFVLPQKLDNIQAYFCNEYVYGTVNILWVSGVIRMEGGGHNKTKGASKKRKVFDAWPSEKAKADTSN